MELTKKWADEAGPKAGVYAIFHGETLLHVGESGCLSKRLNNLRSTYNHSFRRSFGKDKFEGERGVTNVSSRRRFSDTIESQLDKEMRKLEICALPIEFGRKEVEEYMISKTPKQRPAYNAKSRRR